MKKFKKLVAVMLAAIMVMAMGTSVYAETLSQAVSGKSSGPGSVTITGVATTNHTFTAYQIFEGKLSGSAGSYVLSDIDWGDCVKGSDLLTYLKGSSAVAYNDGTDDHTWASIFSSCEDAADVAAKLTETNSDALVKAFADLLASKTGEDYTYLKAYSASTNSSDGSGPYSYTISGLNVGYYLVIDSYTNSQGTDDSLSDYFLQVVGTTTAVNKTVWPEVTKTIGTDKYAASVSAGDTVSFTLTSTIPSDVAKYYTSYTYKFVDTLSTNLTYTESTSKLKVVASKSGETDVTLVKDGSDGYTVSFDSQTLTVTLSNALKYAGWTITVTYDVTVATGISSASAETNEVYIEYSNNPNTTDTGKTATKEVYLYTFDLEVKKTDGDENSVEALSTAAFTLYKKDATVDSSSDFDSNYYYTISGTTATRAASYTAGVDYYVMVGNAQTVSGSVRDGYSTTFSGLAEGTYALVESNTPTGYNTADAVIFTVTPTYAADGSSVTELTIDNNNVGIKTNYSVLSTTIKNYSGTTIPTTGGMGTTILYIIGAILVIGAAVLLITRRRMANR